MIPNPRKEPDKLKITREGATCLFSPLQYAPWEPKSDEDGTRNL